MRKSFRFLTTVTALSLLTVIVTGLTSPNGVLHAQGLSPDFDLRFSQDFNYSWDFTGGGARAAGMGNAFTAVADDPFALSWNPAGLVDLDEIYMSFDWMDYVPSGSYDFNGFQTLGHSGATSNFFRNAALVAPLVINKHKFVLGLGLARHFDTYDLFAEKIYPHESSTAPIDLTATRQGFLNSANLGLSTTLSEKFSVGLTGNIYFGKVVIDQNRIEGYNSLVFPGGQLVDGSRSVRQLDSLTLSGFNFNVGARFTASESTELGLTIRTPFKIKLSDDIKMHRIFRANGAIVSAGGSTSDTLIWADQESKIEMPLMVTFGLAHHWSEKFLSSIDIEYRGFSSSNFLLLDSSRISQGGTKETFFRTEPSSWNNVLQIRIGGEYTLKSKIGDIPLRAGFGYLPQPFSDINDYSFTFGGRDKPIMPLSAQATDVPKYTQPQVAFNANQDIDLSLDSFGDQVSAINVSFGFGIHSAQRALDIAYSFTSFSQSVNTSSVFELGVNEDPSLPSKTYDNKLSPDASPYLVREGRNSVTKVRDHRIMVSFTGYF